MNRNQIEGKWEQLKGLAKEKWGRLTDDDLLQIKGRGELLKGRLRERYGFTQEQVEDEVEEFLAGYDNNGSANGRERRKSFV